MRTLKWFSRSTGARASRFARQRRSQAAAKMESLDLRVLFATAIGTNFSGGSGSSFAPPDTDGSVGPSDYAQFINSRFAVYAKSTGSQRVAKTDTIFWTSAGISSTVTNAGLSDPRVIYDPLSSRWFASEINTSSTGNQLLVARSDTTDPAGTWKAVNFTANSGFADYPTLGVDAFSVQVGLNNFTSSVGSAKSVSIFTIPKADLLLASPSAANRSTLEQTNGAMGISPQGANNFNASQTRTSIVARNYTTFSRMNRTIVTGTGAAGATFGATSVLTTQTTNTPADAHQPDGTQQIDSSDIRVAGAIYQVGDLIYATHSVVVGTHNAVRVVVLSDSATSVVTEATYSSTTFDYIFPSICANAQGNIVIGFTRSAAVLGSGASNGNLGSYAIEAKINPANPAAGITFVGSEIQLKAGTASNYHLFGGAGERWGDYSATGIDPNNPTSFWTTQEYAVASNTWGTQISQVYVAPQATSVTSTAVDGTFGVGATIPITVTFNDAVAVSGTPRIQLNTGGFANYASGSGTNTLTFNYVVAAGQTTADLDYSSTTALTLNGGTINDQASGLASELTLASPGAANSLGANKNIVIDSTAPSLTLTAPITGTLTNNTTPTFSGIAGTAAGDSTTVTIKIYSGGSVAGSPVQMLTTSAIAGNYSIAASPALPAGTYTAQASQSDGAGNTGVSTASTFTIDNMPVQVLSSSFEFDAKQKLLFAFNKNVGASLAGTDPVVENLTTASTISSASIFLNYVPNTGAFTFAAILADGNYRATLPAGSVQDAAGNALGSDNVVNFFVLSADANRDRFVDTQDFNILAGNFGTAGTLFSQGNFNYDSTIDSLDFNALVTNYGVRLPAAAPVPAPAALFRASPPTFGSFTLRDSDDSQGSLLS